jgi:hypothetical protein
VSTNAIEQQTRQINQRYIEHLARIKRLLDQVASSESGLYRRAADLIATLQSQKTESAMPARQAYAAG